MMGRSSPERGWGHGLYRLMNLALTQRGSTSHHLEHEDSQSGFRKYTSRELSRATNGFKKRRTYDNVYKWHGTKGSPHRHVVIAEVRKERIRPQWDYVAELQLLGRLNHKNMVRLLGWCEESDRLLLVYEFVENGSLESHMNHDAVLPWEVRYRRIAIGLASALLYLHDECSPCVVHRHIQPSNIFLDDDFNPKLLLIFDPPDLQLQLESVTTVHTSTMMFKPPELFLVGKETKESDIYSFGIVVLHLATGMSPDYIQLRNLHQTGVSLELADRRLDNDFDRQEMERLLFVGRWCTSWDSSSRPSAAQILVFLHIQVPRPTDISISTDASSTTTAATNNNIFLPSDSIEETNADDSSEVHVPPDKDNHPSFLKGSVDRLRKAWIVSTSCCRTRTVVVNPDRVTV